jgi:hypothetical protein
LFCAKNLAGCAHGWDYLFGGTVQIDECIDLLERLIAGRAD